MPKKLKKASRRTGLTADGLNHGSVEERYEPWQELQKALAENAEIRAEMQDITPFENR